MYYFVKQEDPHGCALACIAMLTGETYKEIVEFYKSIFNEEHTKEGTSIEKIRALLTLKGIKYNIYAETPYLVQGNVYLMDKPSETNNYWFHSVLTITDKDGGIWIYDPMLEEPYEFKQDFIYCNVLQIVQEQ